MTISGFERFWNSTFGVPQQILMRLLRVALDAFAGGTLVHHVNGHHLFHGFDLPL